jgi:hypothetical protein
MSESTIFLNGYARGGTNIVWNLLQSHPDITTPIDEIGQLRRRSLKLRIAMAGAKKSSYFRKIVKRELEAYQLNTLTDPDNQFKAEGVRYNENEVASSCLCLKGVTDDVLLADSLLAVYPGLYFIALVRNGYALADGYLRGGKTIEEAADIYGRVYSQIKRCEKLIPNFMMIKFEDVLEDPFGVSQKLFEFVGAEPTKLDHLRLKSKRVIQSTGEATPAFGERGRKYWFDRESIGQILDPSITSTQISRLSLENKQRFASSASEAMEYFGYE